MAADFNFSDVVLPVIPPSWEWKRLVELVNPERGICYGIVQPGAHDPTGIPMINTQDISNGIVNHQVEFRVAQQLNAKFKRSQLRGGEILVTLVGANFGRVAVAPASYAGFNCARPVGVVPVENNAAFVALALRAPFAQRLIQVWANTTAQPTLNLSDLARIPIALPPKAEQQRITELVTAFDNKIDLNRRMNQTLEEMAQALFRSWFVDFDPVRAKAEGRQPEGMDAETAALFPSRFVDSEVGEIPEGWSVAGLGEFLRNHRHQVEPSELPPTTPYIGLEHMPRGSICLDTWESVAKVTSGKLAFQKGQILFGKLRPYFKKVGVALVDGVCSSDILVIEPSDPASFGWALGHLTRQEFIDYTSNVSAGTRMPRVAWEDIARFKVAAPPGPHLPEAFNRIARTFVSRMSSAVEESATLSGLRDNLLPKLLSGEIRVREAEAQLAESA